MKRTLSLSCVVFLGLAASAFDLPVAEGGGVRVAIGGLDQRKVTEPGYDGSTFGLAVVSSGVDRVFTVAVTNVGKASVRGRLRCALNDGDWLVVPDADEPIVLAPGAGRTVTRTLRATSRAIRGIYPVHAIFTPDDRPSNSVDAVGFFFSLTAKRPFFHAGPKPRLPGKKPAAAPAAVSSETWRDRERTAREAAVAALRKPEPTRGRFRLSNGRETFGVAIVPGACGVLDGVLAFADGERTVAFRGFEAKVDGRTVPSAGNGIAKVDVAPDGDGCSVTHWADFDYLPGLVPLRVTFRAERGGLRVQWDMPGVTRAENGSPFYTHLALAGADTSVLRVYGGCGNVIERPKAFTLRKGGFSLSTRHVGVDYENGLSLVTAVGLMQDRLVCEPERNYCSVHTHEDALFTFVPSARGSFAAARHFADLSGYGKGSGVDAINGTFAMDNGPADYQHTAWAFEDTARYGITNGVFVKHHWQRYGYDVRLPDIYPPRGDFTAFTNMVSSCHRAGIRFCPHDNYSDFYADAEGYRFDRIRFFPDGTAWMAWGFNPGGRRVQSYKWLPMASLPFSERNYRLMRDGFGPKGLFIDVLGVRVPEESYDREGRIVPARTMYESLCRTFDLFRTVTGQPDAPTISETGCDNLIGHLDSGETDHFAANRNYDWLKREQYGDSERVPWHDIVTHGKFVMLAGGMGHRYSGNDASGDYNDNVLHGYGSDDYLATTVIGGRTPAACGPCDRTTVKTAWLVGDICARLAHETFECFAFDETIHRQHAVFSNGGEVWVNRETNRTWTVAEGQVLGTHGFYARHGASDCGVVRQGAVSVGFARRPGVLFVDARVPSGNGNAAALAECEVLERLPSKEPNVLRLRTRWEFAHPGADAKRFVFAVPPGREGGVLANGWFEPSIPNYPSYPAAGEFTLTLRIPDGIKSDSVDVIWGASGQDCRYPFAGRNSPGGSVRAGHVKVRRANGKVCGLDFEKYDPEADAARWGQNVARTPVACGGVETDGAVRLEYGPRPGFWSRLTGEGMASWRLTPLPGSLPFFVRLDLRELGASGATVSAVVAEGPKRLGAAEPQWTQTGDVVEVRMDGRSFAYRMRFE